MNRNFKGIWFPKEIWLMKELSFIEKGLLLEIDSLDCTPDHCFASNSYFAEFFNCSISTIKRSISNLIRLNFIECLSNNSTKRVLKSGLKMYSLAHGSGQNEPRLGSKRAKHSGQNEPHNNTSINNTSNKEKEVKEKENNGGKDYSTRKERGDQSFSASSWARRNFDSPVLEVFLDFLEMRKTLKAINSERAMKLLKGSLTRYLPKRQIEMIEQSIVNSWKGLFDIKNSVEIPGIDRKERVTDYF